VVQGDEAALELFVAYEQLPEPVEPTVADLNDPASGLAGRVSPLHRALLGSTNDVWDVAVGEHDLQGWLAVVAGVGAQVLAAALLGYGSLDDTGLQNGFKTTRVIDVRPGHDER